MPAAKMQIPLGQKRLTNVAVVRLRTHGKKFEIACYKNKVKNWRDGIEKDLSEVIQIDTVFENVSKAVIAKEKDLLTAFGTKDLEECCKMILKNGELQVSDREREVQLESLFRDIVMIAVERCVHTQTGRKHTALAVENALRSVGFSVQPEQTAKKQALKAIESLCTELPDSFKRAQMRLRIVCPEELFASIKRHLVEESKASIEEEQTSAGVEGAEASCAVTFVCDPRQYRELDKLVTVTHNGKDISLQVVESAVVADVGAGVLDRSAAGVGLDVVSAGAVPNATCGGDASINGYAAEKATAVPASRQGPKCSSCAAVFEDAAQYRSHCKSEWHNYNIKRKVKNQPPVSEEEFVEISLDAREGFLGGD